MLARFIVVTIVCLTSLGMGRYAEAQEVDRIAAVVNDEMISIHDLEARLKLAIVMSNLPDSIENRRRAVPQVLRKMVDERIQMQEAARLKVSVGGDEVNRSIANIERQNRMPPGGLLGSLSKAGVDTDVVRDQLRADLAWLKLISRVIQSNIKIGEDEISDRLELIRQQVGHPEYQLAEIFLNVDSPAQEEEARRLGERLMEQLKAGAPFSALARQFSQSASAGQGGMLGWVVDSNLDEEIRTAIATMGKGDVSPLIRVGTGFNIVAVIDKRVAGSQHSDDETMNILQITFPYQVGAAVSRDQLKAKALDLTAPLKSCREFEEFGRKMGSDKAARLDNGRKSELPPTVRTAVEGLPTNKASAPQEAPEGLLVLMVCSRTSLGAAGGVPSRDVIRRQIEDEKVDLQGKRYLRDLRRAAFVDFRL
ncbi:parvulin peptidyl-prolyl isomerase [Paramagnetospirillum kuznetsovii]|uniref:Parvulin-like PPIase n=1 Tax=Paramagnetospirillum kuznetsovii TaxID=2053833 RepID=A0A364NUD6_9PROT|nr:peptidylprolyl isomerase [Paramagnetospirillum kuznetsovii]RAU20620.1 parvulin peptidyl-prolyl isomerase [Paramagnetospirillum kuznetsovii]